MVSVAVGSGPQAGGGRGGAGDEGGGASHALGCGGHGGAAMFQPEGRLFTGHKSGLVLSLLALLVQTHEY